MAALLVQPVVLEVAGQVATLARAALAAARTRSTAILCTYGLPGDVLCIGRYHVVPRSSGGTVSIVRRLTGGRVFPLGDGFAGIVLAVPHGGALVNDAMLAPHQIPNRYVRGLLGALEGIGVAAYYPGRDRVTIDGRTVAALGFEVEPDGATLIEMSVALGRSFAEVSMFADRADPAGVVPMEIVLPEQGASVAEITERAPSGDEMAGALASGYATRLGVEVAIDDAIVAAPADDPAWLEAGRLASNLDRHARARDMLGVVEVHAERSGDRVADLRIGGDLIAPSTTMARLEAALRGAPVAREVLRARVAEVLAAPGAFVLGVRSPATIADLVAEACGA
jgi:hypothetical protein